MGRCLCSATKKPSVQRTPPSEPALQLSCRDGGWENAPLVRAGADPSHRTSDEQAHDGAESRCYTVARRHLCHRERPRDGELWVVEGYG